MGDHTYEGFPDLTELPEAERLRVARWASQLDPATLTAEQEVLLARHEPPEEPGATYEAAERHARALEDPVVRLLWSMLDREHQLLVLDPGRRPAPRDRGFPMSTPELAAFLASGVTDRQVRYWADHGLLPHVVEGRNRSFGQAAAIVGFHLAANDELVRALYRRAVEDPRVTWVATALALLPLDAKQRSTAAADWLRPLTGAAEADPGQIPDLMASLEASLERAQAKRAKPRQQA